jgi:hypothetical protein
LSSISCSELSSHVSTSHFLLCAWRWPVWMRGDMSVQECVRGRGYRDSIECSVYLL